MSRHWQRTALKNLHQPPKPKTFVQVPHESNWQSCSFHRWSSLLECSVSTNRVFSPRRSSRRCAVLAPVSARGGMRGRAGVRVPSSPQPTGETCCHESARREVPYRLLFPGTRRGDRRVLTRTGGIRPGEPSSVSLSGAVGATSQRRAKRRRRQALPRRRTRAQ
jgi:hypothetical protein